MFAMNYLKICHWNANGINQHKLEIDRFIKDNKIDIMLISETHLTDKYNFRISGYYFYDTKHPEGKGHGGTGILINQRIPHHLLPGHCSAHIQATSISVKIKHENLVVSSIYCPPNHKIQSVDFKQFFATLGHKFIAAGDYNAKHLHWGSRLNTPRGRQLIKTVTENGYDVASCGCPTYWPTDRRKIPDLIDFAVTKNINRNKISTSSLLDLSSDHSPVLLEYWSEKEEQKEPVHLTNRLTNWSKFKMHVAVHLEKRTPLLTQNDIDAEVQNLNNLFINAAHAATPNLSPKSKRTPIKTVSDVSKALTSKRKLRRLWQEFRSPESKHLYNQAKRKLQQLLKHKQQVRLENFLNSLGPTEETNYSLWKVTRNMKRPQRHEPPIRLPDGSWAKSDDEKAEAFANHLEEVFQPNESKQNYHPPNDILPSIKLPKIKLKSVQFIINSQMDPKKAPGHDKITGKMVKELPPSAIRRLAQLFNAILRTGHFPETWKLSTVTMIPKPGKDITKIASYRPISLLPTLSKLFEKIVLHKMMPEISKLIPLHQFGFQAKHGTIEQVHRIVAEIRKAFEEKKYCSAIFLDVAQAFDKVWHDGLLYKVKCKLPQLYPLLTSYLANRKFQVRLKSYLSSERGSNAGVPQGSVIGPVLYLIYTADIPVCSNLKTHTFADDTAVISTHKNPRIASADLQEHVHRIEDWFDKWRIKVNESKSVHITFTLNKQTCPAITLNGVQVPQQKDIKYLGIHLDRRLTWKKHLIAKRDQIKIKLSQLYWLIGKHSKLKLGCKLLVYNSILKPIWSYGCQLWQTTCSSNIDIIQRLQSKILRIVTGAPWYVRNANIHKDLCVNTVKEELNRVKLRYAAKLFSHPNILARRLRQQPTATRLRKKILDFLL